ncbi:MAG: acyltransferase [Akkermansia sp.]|nr:acyltransferase [Akkermansia sp.]
MHSKKKYNTLIRLPISISTVEPGARVELHDHCGLSGCKIVCANHVSVGEYTIIGPDAILYDCKEHEYSPEIGWLGRTQRTGKPIIIGKRCYIGMRSIILKGVTIGDDCVVAAGAVVTKDMPAGHIAIGNPATYSPLPAHLTAPAP